MTDQWRELELLVSNLEHCLGGEQVKIKSPDWIEDKVTGEMREIDVSVRSTVGSTDVLIILECRRRGRRQGVGWIEEIATKAQDVGAQMAVAVSAKPFSAPAVKKAAAKGIDLRTFEQLGPGEVVQWLGSMAYNFEIFKFSLVFSSNPELRLAEDIVIPIQSIRADAPVFVRFSDGQAVSAYDAFPLFDLFMIAADRTPPAQKVRARMVIPVPSGRFAVDTQHGRLELAQLEIEAAIERRLSDASASSYRYLNQSGGVIAIGAQLSIDHFGIPVVVDFVPSGAGSRGEIMVRRNDHDGDRLLGFEFSLRDEDGAAALNTSGLLRASKKSSSRRKPKPAEH